MPLRKRNKGRRRAAKTSNCAENLADFDNAFLRYPARGLCLSAKSFSSCRTPAFLLAVARHTERLQVRDLVAAAFALRHDVVHMRPFPMHQCPTRLALIAISQQHLSPCCLPPWRAIASSRCRWPGRVRCPWPLTLPNPWRFERRQPVGHRQPLNITVPTVPVLFVVADTNLMKWAANVSSGMAYARPSAVDADSVTFTTAPSLSYS